VKMSLNSMLILTTLAAACSDDKSQNIKTSSIRGSNVTPSIKAKDLESETYAQQDLHFATLAVNLSKALVESGVDQKAADTIAAKGAMFKRLGSNFAEDLSNYLSGVLEGLYDNSADLPRADSTLNILGESIGHSTMTLATSYSMSKPDVMSLMKTAVASSTLNIPGNDASAVAQTLLRGMLKAMEDEKESDLKAPTVNSIRAGDGV